MHSTLVRAQNVFGFFTTVAFSIAAFIALSSFVFPQTPSATLKLRNVQVVRGRPHYYSNKKEEYAHVKFDLDADISTLFTWNTKQVFLYITATYPSLDGVSPPSQAVIWDAILPSRFEPWHQNQYIHPKKSKGRRSANDKSTTYLDASSHKSLPGIIVLDNQRPKYQITDASGKLGNRTDAVLELGWNIQPWVGALTWAQTRDYGMWSALKGGRSKKFEFPSVKGKKEGDTATAKGGEGYKLHVGGDSA